MKTTDVLKWAAGAAAELSANSTVNESELLYLLGHHRLAGRFADRVRRERPAWCSRQLMIRAWQRHAQAKTQLTSQLQAVREVLAKLGANSAPLVLLKGASAYALTGDERTIHFSSDLDVLYDDLERLRDALLELGYRPGPSQPEVLGDYEFGQLYRGNVIFELHRYFPVWSYPAGVAEADLIPAHHPGVWRQNFGEHTHCEIGYREVCEYSHGDALPQLGAARLASPELCALISCAHIVKNFMSSPAYTPFPFFLGELADVFDLTQLADFDAETLRALTDKFHGHDAVQFCANLMQAYFGSNPLAAASSRDWPHPDSFPRSLSLGCWASLYRDADELLLPLGIETIVERLGANAVTAVADAPRRVYAVLHCRKKRLKMKPCSAFSFKTTEANWRRYNFPPFGKKARSTLKSRFLNP